MTHGSWQIGHGKSVGIDRPAVFAILNVTPDSFSDGGELPTPAAAAAAAERAIEAGAVGVDVGGESTRPGAEPVGVEEQIRRVVPAIEAIRRAIGVMAAVSVDTTSAAVAAAAIDAGADIINDVSAGRDDEGMLPLAAARGVGLILMHRLAPPRQDRYSDQYDAPPDYAAEGGVVQAVRAFLAQRVADAQAAGVVRQRIVIDPGLGFGKTVEQNLGLIAGTPELAGMGLPVLSALSRKSFTARAAGLGSETPPRERLAATIGLSVAHLTAGARVFRVHDVCEHVQALGAAWAAMASK
ncbi:MAG: dihydropteroate synthase [Phycisphaeraceae bacterium]|nr:dihydropteroate synthase [Phycisphaeraceae bacterium]